jgi:stage V sporulation protein B
MAGILQGLGKPSIAVITLFAGVIVKIIATYIFVGIPSLNIVGAAIGSTLAYITIGILNLILVKKYTDTNFDLSLTFYKPLISGIAMSIFVVGTYYLLSIFISSNLSTAIAVIVGAVVYGVTLILTKGINKSEIMMLPKGNKMVSILIKVRLMK